MELLRQILKHRGFVIAGVFISAAGWASHLYGGPFRLRYAGAVVVLIFVFAAMEAFDDVRGERDEALERLSKIDHARPRLRCTGQRWVAVAGKPFSALQVMVRNEPDARTPESLAKNVSVRLTFFPPHSVHPLCSYEALWLLSVDPESAGFTGTAPVIDIPANDNAAMFFLALQHPADEDAFAYSFAKLEDQPDGRVHDFRLAPGRYRVTVALKGDNVEQELVLHLLVHGTASPPELERITH